MTPKWHNTVLSFPKTKENLLTFPQKNSLVSFPMSKTPKKKRFFSPLLSICDYAKESKNTEVWVFLTHYQLAFTVVKSCSERLILFCSPLYMNAQDEEHLNQELCNKTYESQTTSRCQKGLDAASAGWPLLGAAGNRQFQTVLTDPPQSTLGPATKVVVPQRKCVWERVKTLCNSW